MTAKVYKAELTERAVGQTEVAEPPTLNSGIRLLAGWTNMVSLNLLDRFIVFDYHTTSVNWSVPVQIHSLGLFVNTPATLDLLAILVKHSAPTLRDVSLVAFHIDHNALAKRLAPFYTKLTRLHDASGEFNSGMLD